MIQIDYYNKITLCQWIKDKQYLLPFTLDSKKTYMVGINFAKEQRTIEKYLIEEAWSIY